MTALAALAAITLVSTGAHQAVIESARATLSTSLKDYPSARFRDARMQRDDPWMVCGYVNAKNGMGGYSGWRQFQFLRLNEHGDGIVLIADDGPMGVTVSETCSDPKVEWASGDVSGELRSR